jgi:hypothetical protein
MLTKEQQDIAHIPVMPLIELPAEHQVSTLKRTLETYEALISYFWKVKTTINTDQPIGNAY